MVSAPPPRATGFTLLELAIATTLLSVGLLALVGSLTRALHAAQVARARHAALVVAESVIDSLHAHGALASGSLTDPGFSLAWAPAGCALAPCVRMVAIVPMGADTVVIDAPMPRRSR